MEEYADVFSEFPQACSAKVVQAMPPAAGGSEQIEDCPIEGQGAVGAGASGSAATAGGGAAAAGAETTAVSGQWGAAGVQGSGCAWQQARDEAATAWQQEGSREARTAAVLDHHVGDGPLLKLRSATAT